MTHGRLFAPVYHGKIVRKKPMASRQVVEHSCDRCTRTWYTDVAAEEQKVELKLTFSIGALSVNYNCLCDGCTQTVGALVMQIAKVMKKSAPVRGAKKKAEGKAEASPTAQSTTTTATEPVKPPTVPASSSHGSAAAGHAGSPSRPTPTR